MPAHARQVVLELRELDLELALGAHGVLGEDVEDQLRPVDRRARRARPRGSAAAPGRARRRRAGSRPRLRAKRSFSSSSLPLPTYVRCAGRGAVLDDAADRLDARRARQLLDLGELRRRDRRPGPAPRGRTRAPAPGSGTWNHRAIMPPAGLAGPILADRTLALVDIAVAVARARRRSTTTSRRTCRCERAYDDGESLLYAKRAGKPLVLLAGPHRHRARRRATCPAGSRTAPCTGSARPT